MDATLSHPREPSERNRIYIYIYINALGYYHTGFLYIIAHSTANVYNFNFNPSSRQLKHRENAFHRLKPKNETRVSKVTKLQFNFKDKVDDSENRKKPTRFQTIWIF